MINFEAETFKDKNGNKSSKRILGTILLVVGVLMSIALFSYSLYTKVADPTTAIDIIKLLVFAGGAMLGVTVFENKK